MLLVQRHALVADILEQSKAQKVIDLGCGEGKLLEHFIRSASCNSAQTLVGLLCHNSCIAQQLCMSLTAIFWQVCVMSVMRRRLFEHFLLFQSCTSVQTVLSSF